VRIKITGGPPEYWQASVYRNNRVARVYHNTVFWKYRADDAHVSWWLAMRLHFALWWQGRGLRRQERLRASERLRVTEAKRWEARWQEEEPVAQLPKARLVSRDPK
jgi:hypothetical protein